MCECLLEGFGKTETPEHDVYVQVHATYKLGSEPADPLGFTPRALAETELRALWLGEDEI